MSKASRNRQRSRARPQPIHRSVKFWAGVAGAVVLVAGAWFARSRGDAAEAEPDDRAAGRPVPLAEAELTDRGPRRTRVLDARLIDTSDDPRKGDPRAPVRIVEFADFQCPSCGQFFRDTHGALNELYGRQLEWVFLDFPLTSIHDRAMPAAIAAACSDKQGKFWAYHDLLFENQTRLGDGDLRDYAKKAGVDEKQWEACFEKRETLAGVEQDMALGNELGVDGTPMFFVGDQTLKGAMPVTAFMEVIDPLLRKAGAGGGQPTAAAGEPAAAADAEAPPGGSRD